MSAVEDDDEYEVVESEVKSSFPQAVGMNTVQFLIMGVIAYFANDGPLKFAVAGQLKLPLLAIGVYLWSMYCFLFRQGLSNNLLNPVAFQNQKDEEAMAVKKNVDRTAMNAVEQSPIFLAALSTFCFFVNPFIGGILGFVYSAFLWLYPFVFGKEPLELLFLSTIPRYLIVQYMVISVVITALRTEGVYN